MRERAWDERSDLGRIRTCDPRVRSTVLYPTELRGQRHDDRGAGARVSVGGVSHGPTPRGRALGSRPHR